MIPLLRREIQPIQTPLGVPVRSTASQAAVAAPDPTKYPAMNQQSELGAQQAYQYFWQTHVYAHVTGDHSPFDKQYVGDCKWCSSTSQEISEGKKLWKAGTIRIENSRVLKAEPGRTDVYMEFATHAMLRGEKGFSDESYAAISILKWQDGSWRVTSVDIEAVDG